MRLKVLIIAKTYPCYSKKYGELVYTAGINMMGEWIRLYPVPFRNLPQICKYKKYQWVVVEVERNTADPRQESYKVIGNIEPSLFINTENHWFLRKLLVLRNIYLDKDKLIADCKREINPISLAVFKPMQILSFHIEENKYKNTISSSEALPFKFYYKFSDINQKISKLQIIDWEIEALTRKLLKKYNDNYDIIKDIISKKYYNDMVKRDIYLFLGTNKEWHIRKSRNPFMIIGVFYPPYSENNIVV